MFADFETEHRRVAFLRARPIVNDAELARLELEKAIDIVDDD